MRRILPISLAASLGAAFLASTAMGAAAPSGPPSVDWKISELLANPGAKAVLSKDLPALLGSDQLDMVKGMTLRRLAKIPQANIDATKLAQIQTDLSGSAAIPATSDAPAVPTPPGPAPGGY